MTTQSGNANFGKAISRSRRFQIGISTVLLLIASLSSWLGFWVLRGETHSLESQLPGLRSAARELQVDDENAITVVNRHKQWSDEYIWDIHLPAEFHYRICLATDNVDNKGLSKPAQFVDLKSGRHKIELVQEKIDDGRSLIYLLIDDKTEIKVEKPKGWDQRLGSSGASQISENEENDPEAPLVLYRMRLMIDAGNGNSKTPAGPDNGILLWVEPVILVEE